MLQEMEYTQNPFEAIEKEELQDDMTDEELDLYFANYVPLSNLPTPPPMKHLNTPEISHSNSPNSTSQTEARCYNTTELEVQATHLSNLVPNNVSSRRPCLDVIIGFLERSKLAAEIVAFAACLLDALSQRFTHAWRAKSLPLTAVEAGTRKSNIFERGCQPCLQSEIIVLSALAIAHGFLSDSDRETRRWAQWEGRGVFSVRELEQTKWCILQDIDYELMSISDEMVQSMLRDMQRAVERIEVSKRSVSQIKETARLQKDKEEKMASLRLNLDGYQGAAVWMNGVQTPEPSP